MTYDQDLISDMTYCHVKLTRLTSSQSSGKVIIYRVAKCRRYDGYIRVKIFAGWGKKSGRTGILAKLGLSWEGFAQLM